MPTRSRSHVIGDIAVNAVMSVISQCGWACEVVHKDYGEDIMIQPDLAGNLDPWRLWIQVKGTDKSHQTFKNQKSHRVQLPISQVRRWILSGDPVIVVLWHITINKGYWSYGPTLEEITRTTEKGQQYINVAFKKSDIFNVSQLRDIVWECRLSHFNSIIADAQAELDFLDSKGEKFEYGLFLLCKEFMNFIGILKGMSLSEDFRKFLLSDVLPQYKNIKFDDDELFLGIAMMGFLQWIGKRSNQGVPGTMMVHCGRFLSAIISATIDKTRSVNK